VDYSRSKAGEPLGPVRTRRTPLVRLIRPLRFCVVGLSALVVNMLMLWLLVNRLRLGVLPASVLANEAAVLVSFLFNDRWTFAAAGRDTPRWRRLLRFNGVALGGIMITVFLLGILVHALSMPLLLANLLAVAAGSLWNYKVGSRWAWGRRRGSRSM
jgi:dolichol-phosphate mannosyltransferase